MICLIVAFADCRERSWVTVLGGGGATVMAHPEVLVGKF